MGVVFRVVNNNKIICRAGCPHPAAEKPRSAPQTLQIICRGRCSPSARWRGLPYLFLGSARGTTPHRLSPELPSRGATANIRLDIGSPRGELSATQTEGWFLAANLTPVGWFLATNLTAVGWFLATNLKDIRSGAMGWFPTQNLKINRTTAMYTQKIYSPITHHRGRAKSGPPPVYDGLSLYTLLVNCNIVLPCGGRIRRGSSFSGSAARQHQPQPAARQCR